MLHISECGSSARKEFILLNEGKHPKIHSTRISESLHSLYKKKKVSNPLDVTIFPNQPRKISLGAGIYTYTN